MTTYRSPLSIARGLGPSHHGSSHWRIQRITSLFMIPLTFWFLVTIMMLIKNGEDYLEKIFSSSWTSILLIAYFSNIAYHGVLGMKVIIEDYVSKHFIRAMLIVVLYAATIITWLSAVSALLVHNLLLIIS